MRRSLTSVTTRSTTCTCTAPTHVACSRKALWVDLGGLKPNTWQMFEGLGSAWEQAKLGIGDGLGEATEEDPEVVANPRRRARTPLTEIQVDAIRTARASGERVVSICRRFDVHQMTVWTHTKDVLRPPTRKGVHRPSVTTTLSSPDQIWALQCCVDGSASHRQVG